jgi:predicted dehydrogenase
MHNNINRRRSLFIVGPETTNHVQLILAIPLRTIDTLRLGKYGIEVHVGTGALLKGPDGVLLARGVGNRTQLWGHNRDETEVILQALETEWGLQFLEDYDEFLRAVRRDIQTEWRGRQKSPRDRQTLISVKQALHSSRTIERNRALRRAVRESMERRSVVQEALQSDKYLG